MLTKKPTTRHDWDISPMPEEAEHLDWQRTFTAEEYRLFKLGFTPDAAAEFWFAFFEDETFFIHYKHSGECICSFQLVAGAEGYQIVNALINRPALPPWLSNKDQLRVAWGLEDIVYELLGWIKRTERPATRTDWKTLPMPEEKVRLDVNIVIAGTQYERLLWGSIPREMEDHWFYFMEDNWLYLHRSWTGYCIYQIKFEPGDGGYKIVEAWANRDPDQHKGDDEWDQKWMSVFFRAHRPNTNTSD